MVEEKEIKIFAGKYLSNLYNDLAEVREHIAGSAEPWSKAEIEQGLSIANNRNDIVGIPQFKEKWLEIGHEFMGIDQSFKQRIKLDNLVSDLANEVHRKLKEIID
jgi:hypothetical protein